MLRSYAVVPGVFSGAEIATLRAAEPAMSFRGARVNSNNEEKPEIRRSQVAWLGRQAATHRWLFERIDDVLRGVNAQYFDVDYRADGCAAYQYSIYAAAQSGHYDWHMDTFLPDRMPDCRKLSFVVQVSEREEYEGGALTFRDLPGPLPAEASEPGSLIAFPSIHFHAVQPVTRGERRSLVGWYAGPPWR